MNNPKPVLQGLHNFCKKRINIFNLRFKRILDNEYEESAEEQLESAKKLIKMQQKVLEDMITKEHIVFSQVEQIENYKIMAKRALSYMAGDHEVCGLFMNLQQGAKYNMPISKYLPEIERLERIFQGELANNGEKIQSWEMKMSAVISHFENLYPNSQRCELKFTDSFRDMDTKILGGLGRTKFVTIVGNLISNSRYFCNKEIVVDLVDNNIVVSDDGKGVDKHRQSLLFTCGETGKPRNGHGFGLFFCREIARENDNELYFDSENKYTSLTGASFVLSLK